MDTNAKAAPPDEQEALILQSVDRFLERDVRPVVHALEATDTYPAEIVEKLKTLGLFGATIAPEYDGLGLPAAIYAKIVERMSAVWMSVPGFFNSHLMMAAAVQRFGTEEQKRRYLSRFASGELRGGVALTEPDCGTDLQAIRTRARREDNHYIVNGAKTWITNSVEGHILAVLVKTDPDARPRHKGMSLLLIEKGPGFKVVRKLEKLGYRGIDTGELMFEDCRVPAANLVGMEEGRGLQQVLNGLELGRINVAARGAGLARAWKNRSPTPRRAGPSASRSPSTRRSRSSSPTWRRELRPRACLSSPPRASTTRAGAATSRREWRSSSRQRPRLRTVSRRCASTAPTATRRSSILSAIIAMRRCSRSGRGPTSCSGSSSHASW
jgi:hypothetical protein